MQNFNNYLQSSRLHYPAIDEPCLVEVYLHQKHIHIYTLYGLSMVLNGRGNKLSYSILTLVTADEFIQSLCSLENLINFVHPALPLVRGYIMCMRMFARSRKT